MTRPIHRGGRTGANVAASSFAVTVAIAIAGVAGSGSAFALDPTSTLTATTPTTTSPTSTTSTTTTLLPTDGVVSLVEDADPTGTIGSVSDTLAGGSGEGSDDPGESPPASDPPGGSTGDPVTDPDAGSGTNTNTSGGSPSTETARSAPVTGSNVRDVPVGVRGSAHAPSPGPSVTATATPVASQPPTDGRAVPSRIHAPGPRPDGNRPTVLVRTSTERSTRELFDLLAGADLSPAAVARLIAPFPVAGVATYSDDFGNPRRDPDGTVRSHAGTDVFAARGTPVVAASDGTVTLGTGGRAGRHVRLTATDGTQYVYAHLDRFAAGLSSGTTVGRGDVVGFVGTSGNAERTPPHVHFEIRTRSGESINPAPHLDEWLQDATAAARTIARTSLGTAGFSASRARVETVTARSAARAATTAGARRGDVPERRSLVEQVLMTPASVVYGATGAGAAPVASAVVVAVAVALMRRRPR